MARISREQKCGLILFELRCRNGEIRGNLRDLHDKSCCGEKPSDPNQGKFPVSLSGGGPSSFTKVCQFCCLFFLHPFLRRHRCSLAHSVYMAFSLMRLDCNSVLSIVCLPSLSFLCLAMLFPSLSPCCFSRFPFSLPSCLLPQLHISPKQGRLVNVGQPAASWTQESRIPMS